MTETRTLHLLNTRLAVCRLPAAAEIPEDLHRESFYSLTRAEGELSLVCPESSAPEHSQIEPGWRCIILEGPLDFDEVGVLAALTQTLAQSGISIFAISTYHTDCLLVKEEQLAAAIRSLQSVGHNIVRN